MSKQMLASHPDFTLLDTPLCELGEGPTYDRHSNKAWWFDIVNHRLYEHNFASGHTITHAMPCAASAMARIDDQRQLVFTEIGLYVRDVTSGTMQLHQAIEADNRHTRSNDARVHPSGAFWLGTMGWQAQTGAGSIYWYFKGELRRLFSEITISNAISFSPDGSIGYFADTARKTVMRVQLDPETGLPQGEPHVFLSDFAHGDPDGAVVDAQGNLWIALWGGSKVAGYSPEGVLLNSIDLPVSQPTCPAFIGPDARKMLVTSAWIDLNQRVRDQQPAGGTFTFDLPFQGKFEPDVKIA